MARRSYTPERIIHELREAEVFLSQRSTVGEAARKIGVTEQTYYRWRREYGALRIDEVKRLRELEKEITRPKRLVADLSLDNDILKEASRGNSERRACRVLRQEGWKANHNRAERIWRREGLKVPKKQPNN